MATSVESGRFAHAALFYRDDGEYLDGVLPFVMAGLANGEPVLIAVPGDNLALLRNALREVSDRLTLTDITVAGRNPAQILALEDQFLARHSGRPVRMVGEVVWPGRSADEYPGCVKHEALVNEALAGHDGAGLCPYDVSRLPDEVLADARTTHPLLWRNGTRDRSADYAPQDALARYNQPLPGDPNAVRYTVRTFADLSRARSFARRYAHWLGLSAEGIADLQVIATELATNSLQHTGGSCRLAFWQRAGHVVCEAGDSGRFDDALAAHRLPPADATTGHGLLVVNAVADLVRTHATSAGTTIQAYLRL